MNMLTKSVVAIALAVACSQLHAQVYKCEGADGKTAYQQLPCSKTESEEKVKIWAQPRQSDIESAQARLQAAEDAKTAAAYEQDLLNAAREESPAPQTPSPARQQQEQLPIASGSCPPGQVPLNASGSDPSRGWSGSKGYVPLRCGNPSDRGSDRVTRTGPGITEPRRIQDQHGNWYNQPPGSAFATDEKTGKQCFVYGNFVRCD